VIYNGQRDGALQLLRRAVDASGDETLVYADDRPKWPLSWTAAGDWLLFDRLDPSQSNDVWALSIAGAPRAEPVVAGPAQERWAQFSPDGRWLAYSSDESGRREVYLRQFHGNGSRLQVSAAGGSYPRWRRDGRELFYVSANRMMATSIALGEATATIGLPMELFPARPFDGFARYFYDVGPDGRFLLAAIPERSETTELTLLINWPTLLTGAEGKAR